MMDASPFTLTRHFDAPPALVWRVWTEPELVKRWYGPGMETEVHRLDAVAGGLWLHEMKMPDASMYQRIEYIEVDPPSKLVMLMANADGDWNAIASPMMPTWPTFIRTTVTFVADGDGTLLTLEWLPHEASPEEISTFEAAVDKLGQGWGKGFDIIAEIVAELR